MPAPTSNGRSGVESSRLWPGGACRREPASGIRSNEAHARTATKSPKGLNLAGGRRLLHPSPCTLGTSAFHTPLAVESNRCEQRPAAGSDQLLVSRYDADRAVCSIDHRSKMQSVERTGSGRGICRQGGSCADEWAMGDGRWAMGERHQPCNSNARDAPNDANSSLNDSVKVKRPGTWTRDWGPRTQLAWSRSQRPVPGSSLRESGHEQNTSNTCQAVKNSFT